MTTFEGHYFDGEIPVAAIARMVFVGPEATLTTDRITEHYTSAQLRVSPRIGITNRFIVTPNGGQFVCCDHAFLDALPQQGWSEGVVAWLEKRWWAALTCVFIVVGVLLAGYFFGLPVAADRLAQRIPIETEQLLGNKTLEWLDQQRWLLPTQLDASLQKQAAQGFEQLIVGLPYNAHYQLVFRSSKFLGPNAFAFPGGIIVITDEMVELAETTEEVLAVLAHEIGHVEERHVTKGILQQSVVAVVVTAITADAASLSVAVTGLPMVVAQMKYSRKFEVAADDFGFKLLKQKGYSPAAFASIMERLASEDAFTSNLEFLSTHPHTKDRVKRARDAAED